ncbi:MAG TPA: SDR family NAD(P)-dependent oxidoreductase [Longimicrobiales bacterium]|jgi:3-oxoacyl-[acyl-carrier protein] reductase
MEIRFDGRVAVVTGAAHGFGREIARQLCDAGAEVWACDLREDELGETARVCGASCHTRPVDVTDLDAVDAFVREAEGEKGAVDVLVNNAGGVLGQVGRPVEDVSPADWWAVMEVNLSAVFYLCRAVVPGMKRAGGGRIVNISSGAGLRPSRTGIQAYASAKAGQINLTRQLAHELGAFGITVNNVAPGFVRSNPATERQWQAYGEEGQRRLVEGIALRRLGTPEDIASAVLFLASEHAAWVTGQVLAVDGGV